ncbi:MAG: nuclear transport factor 2 family protein [Verrucomicrobia bacterium]|nr:nuclear transport factor 2 family protein [Verrucomicrobiota bacterium]
MLAKKYIRTSIVAATCVASAALVHVAQGQDLAREQDHEALRQLTAALTQAINAKDLDALAAHLSSNFVYTASDQTTVTSRAEFDAFYARLFTAPDAPLKDLQIEVSPAAKTTFLSETVGVCYGTVLERYTLADGKDLSLHAHWTATLAMETDGWKLAAVHIGVNFLENPVMAAAKNGAKMVLLGCGVLGLAVGFFVGRARKS